MENGQRYMHMHMHMHMYAHPILECPECPVVLDTALVPFVIDINGVKPTLPASLQCPINPSTVNAATA